MSDARRNCLKALAKSGSKLSAAEAAEVAACIKLGVRGGLGNPPTVEACFVADAKGRVSKMKKKAIGKELQKCVPPGGLPEFAIPDVGGSYNPSVDADSFNAATHRMYAPVIANAAVSSNVALAADLFGPFADSSINLSGDRAALCQTQIMKVLQKCEGAKRKVYNTCRDRALKVGSVSDAAGLAAACFQTGTSLDGLAASQSKTDAVCGSKLTSFMNDSCPGVPIAATFPGPCHTAGTAASFAQCVIRRLNCRLCQQMNTSEQLGKDCDTFDDNTSNGSCSDTVGFCGDGVLDPSLEVCDDGNVDDGDCCSSTCTFEASGSACGDQEDNECTHPNTCNGAGVCQANHEAEATACGDDGIECTLDQCDDAGACIHPNRPAGFACGDATDTDCNNPDTCNASGQCVNNKEAAGTACTSDANECTDDTCTAGGDCAHTNNTASCDDGSYCNGADTCAGGSCGVHAGNPCPGADGDGNCSETCDEDSDSCTAPDPNGTACDDGSYCNGTETCQAGVCAGSTGNPCPGPDGDDNCSESCNEDANNCTAPDTDGSSCTDGAFCTGADSCQSGSCSVHAGNPCSGGSECADSCNEALDNCFDTAGTVCGDDGNPCTDEQCNGAGACVHPNKLPETPCPDDGVECTFDKCDGGGTCAHPAKIAGTACTTDNNGCTDDVCNGGGSCVHNNNTAPCTDNVYCNGADTCSNGSCSVHAGDPCPGTDGDVNCTESCDEAHDNCAANDPNGSACSNGQTCDGADTCQNGTCTPSGVCCGTKDFTFTITSSSGGAFTAAEWPGGTTSQNGAVAGCSATINRPSGRLDTVGGSGGSDSFSVNSFAGYTACVGTGGEDGDGCQPNGCPPAGIGSCQNARPSCSAALNGSGSAKYFVHCTDP